jgi:septal ring factor EnvC (AmiA/AmiB activator)
MSKFEREQRYAVFKLSDMDAQQMQWLSECIVRLPRRQCVVVEADWPEYEPIWRMIERRVAGLPEELTAAQSELAALREELAKTREAAKEELEGVKYTRRKFRQERDDLQQRLTAAEQRNAELEGLLHEVLKEPWLYDVKAKILAALKPTESGASE